MISSGERIRAGYKQSLSGNSMDQPSDLYKRCVEKVGLNLKFFFFFPEACNDRQLDSSCDKNIFLSIAFDECLI